MHTVRTATPSDLNSVRDILRSAYAPYLDELPDLPDVGAIEHRDLEDNSAWVAVRAGQVDGILLAAITPPTAHLINVAVAPRASGQGLARMLIDQMLQAAKRAGCLRVDLATHPDMGSNIAIYERMGWTVTDRSDQKVTMCRSL